MKILEVKNVKKIYGEKGAKVEALSKLNFSVNEGEFIAIMGESGSGKTTLLNIISSLDKPTEGDVYLAGKNLSNMKPKDLAAFRRNELGFVFQDFNLLDTFNNRDNIYLPLVLSGEKQRSMRTKLNQIKDALGIEQLLDKYPYEVSGGQKQRIAIARAIITNPRILLADEPTGALDSGSSEMILNLFKKINSNGQTLLMVTHSVRAASYASRILFIKDGCVYHELYRGDEDQHTFMERINQSMLMLGKRGGQDER